MKNQLTEPIRLLLLLRTLWEQHVYWTRFFIISTAADLGDLEPVTQRLLQNPGDFARALEPFYGHQNAETFNTLLTQHLLIAADLVNAAKGGDTSGVMTARRKWYQNAVEIAVFLASINPYWNQRRWQNMLFRHLDMTEKEATLRLKGLYAEDIHMFNIIEDEALQMADYMVQGMTQQFF